MCLFCWPILDTNKWTDFGSMELLLPVGGADHSDQKIWESLTFREAEKRSGYSGCMQPIQKAPAVAVDNGAPFRMRSHRCDAEVIRVGMLAQR